MGIMNIMRSIARWGLIFLISTFVSVGILIATLNATIANRDVVKQWLATSGVYKQGLGSTLQVSADNQSSSSLMDVITANTLQQALVKTFDAAYIQQHTNKVIDATYNWLEGKSQAITFSVPVQERAADFNANLAAEIKPTLQALPPCTSKLGNLNPSKVSCIPSGVSIDDYAKQLAQPSSDNGFLGTPITQDTFKGQFPEMSGLPKVMQSLQGTLWTLGVGTIICALLFVLASTQKLVGLGQVGRQLTINAGLVLLGGLCIWYAGSSLDMTVQGDQQQQAVVSSLISPLARTIIPDVGRTLSLFSGVVTAIGGVIWLGAYLVRRRLHNDAQGPHIPPASPIESHLPAPAAKPTIQPKP